MPDLILHVPNHGYEISDTVYVSWLDGNYYVRDDDNTPLVEENSFKISTDDSDDNIVQYIDTITDGYVREVDVTTGATTISGLDHLEGRVVKVTSGGEVVATATVSSGSITVSSDIFTYQVGLPYTCKIRTTRIATPQMGNALQGQIKRINRSVVRYARTKNGKAGQEYAVKSNAGEQVMTEFLSDMGATFDTDSRDAVIPVKGGMAVDGYTTIKSEDPYPMTIISAVVEFSIDETR